MCSEIKKSERGKNQRGKIHSSKKLIRSGKMSRCDVNREQLEQVFVVN